LIELLHPRFPASWAIAYNNLSPTVFLLLFITYYSLLGENGWLSVAFDLVYVYFWPLVLAWLLVKFTSVRAYRAIKDTNYMKAVIAIPIAANTTAKPVEAVAAAQATEPSVKSRWKAIGVAVRPFSQFFLLWALLLLKTSSVVLTWVALAVIILGTITIVRALSLFLSDAGSWITKLKSNFANQLANDIAIIRASYQSPIDVRSRNAANGLLLYETMFRYMSENKETLARWTILASILVTIPLYLYLSFMFTAIYLGVARLSNLSWAWTDALTTSIFIPFAYTDLPHNLWIRLIGGCQATIIAILGYTVLFRRIQGSMIQLSQAAGELAVPLNDHSLKEMLKAIKTQGTEKPA
jgi:hypothetical protein